MLEPYVRETDSTNRSQGSSFPTHTLDVPQPTITPTPIYYTIVEGDTLSSIAYRHQVSLLDLVSANPDIDPNFLTIGISITIPMTGSVSTALLEPTPIPLDVDSPICYPYQSGALFCLVQVTNRHSFDVENITVDISILSKDGQYKNTLEAKSLVNVLKSGQSTALSAYYPGPIPDEFLASASLTSVLPLPPEDERYLDVDLPSPIVEISEDGRSALISGNINSRPENPSIQRLWLVAIAYDKDHQPVGIRKWIAETQLPAGGEIPFQIVVYSLGTEIAEVGISYEATP